MTLTATLELKLFLNSHHLFNSIVFTFKFYVPNNWLAVILRFRDSILSMVSCRANAFTIMKHWGYISCFISQFKSFVIAFPIIAKRVMQGIVSNRDTNSVKEISTKIFDSPNTIFIIINLYN